MKRIAVILLLLILSFNFCGYRLLIGYMNEASTEAIEKKADAKDYTDAELMSVKTTLNLPYYTGSSEFERAYGSITVNGQDYEYVKRRVHNDTLELLCLPNVAKTRLKTAGSDLVKASSGEGNASVPIKKSSTTLKINFPDFYQTLSLNIAATFTPAGTKAFASNDAVVINGYHSFPERPPQAV